MEALWHRHERAFSDHNYRPGAGFTDGDARAPMRGSRKYHNSSPDGIEATIAAIAAQPETRQEIRHFLQYWKATMPQVQPATVAWALRAADHADEWHRRNQQIELVWTGPAPRGSTFRRTDQALLHVVNSAQSSLWIVTFAAYRVDSIVNAIGDATARGVAVHFVAESSEATGGRRALGAIEALRTSLPPQVALYIWPLAERPHDDAGNTGSLHVKCAVADEKIALISSANLTGHAMNINMELGLLIKGGEVPQSIALHLRQLIEAAILVRLSSE
jgi:phosphatidylserine/phosphatidylglycerophosphate/cardiolipin synthase-like enzyme